MDGYEVTRQIKADPTMRSIPIIAITSHALNGEEQTARAAGCDDYVPEPYSPRQLLAKCRSQVTSPDALYLRARRFIFPTWRLIQNTPGSRLRGSVVIALSSAFRCCARAFRSASSR